MSEQSKTPDLVELVGRLFEAANRRDFDAVMRFYASDGVWEATGWASVSRVRPRSAASMKTGSNWLAWGLMRLVEGRARSAANRVS
jgi:ketosteroid isomerase-like protein